MRACEKGLTRGQGWYKNKYMRALLCTVFAAATAAMFSSCTTYDHTCILEVSDLPLKSVNEPSRAWESAPLRANALYVLHGAESDKARRDRIGDYYFVTWYDAQPTRPVKLVMRYTQAATGAQVLTSTIDYSAPRRSAGRRTDRFFFAGEERKKKGDIMTWRIDVYVDGKSVDSKQSYLWE